MAKLSKSTGVFALVILLLAAVIAVIVFVALRGKAPAPAAMPVGKPTAQPLPAYAPPGELTPGFPKELILGGEATSSGSYAINYGSGPSLRTASFGSAKSMLSLFNLYKTYFRSNGWTVVNEITKYQNSRGLYAVKSGAVSSVSIIDNGKTREVVVSYSGK